MSGQRSITRHFPHFFQTEDTENLFYRFVQVFGSMLEDGENDLLALMRAHWMDTADNKDSKGFDTDEKGDLDKIFALYVEALQGTSLLRQIGRRDGPEGLEDDAVYRERIKRLIHVLRDGASTVEGIREIVAANLGIHGDSPEARAARDSIRIEEYIPRFVKAFDTANTPAKGLRLFESFFIKNPNPEDTPVEIRVKSKTDAKNFIQNLRIKNITTEQYAEYQAVLNDKDELVIYTDGSATVGSNPNEDVIYSSNYYLILPPGVSEWQIQAVAGQFSSSNQDEKYSDYKSFYNEPNHTFVDADPQDVKGKAIFLPAGPIVELSLSFLKYHPASFRVSIPWNIPGYSEALDALPEKPRFQIPFILNRVKAAGVYVEVTFHQAVLEDHRIDDKLTALPNQLDLTETQDMQDSLAFGALYGISGFDQTYFD